MLSPLVIVSAAMAVPSGYYRPLVEAFAAQGWSARTVPTTGFERDAPTASWRHDWSYASEASRIGDAVVQARAEEPGRPVVLLGHSLGGQLGALVQGGDEPADALVTVGAGIPHFRVHPYGGLPVLAMGMLVPLVTRVVGHVPPPLFGAPGARTLMREWAGFIRSGRPPFDVPAPLRTPSLLVALEGDQLAPERSIDAYADLFLDPALTTRWTYRQADAPPGGSTDHVAWVRRPELVVSRVVRWWDDEATPQAKASIGGHEQARFRSP